MVISATWIKILNVKNLEILSRICKYLSDLRVENVFLNKKKKGDYKKDCQFSSIKIKNFCSLKDIFIIEKHKLEEDAYVIQNQHKINIKNI